MSVKIRDNTPAAFRKMSDVASGRLRDFGEKMAVRAKRNSPHDTGHNRDSISMVEIDPLHVQVQTESGYGAYLELGTARMGARPYFAPAFAETKHELSRG